MYNYCYLASVPAPCLLTTCYLSSVATFLNMITKPKPKQINRYINRYNRYNRYKRYNRYIKNRNWIELNLVTKTYHLAGDMGVPAPPPPPRKEPADWESRFNFRTDIPQPQMYMPMPKTYPSKDATMKGMFAS